MFYLCMALLAAFFPSTPEADQCPICLAPFHGRSVPPVVVTTQCCCQRFDLDCISRYFTDQPIGSRRCAMCRQDPMPLVNQNTSESHPDTFFPDRTFFRACLFGDLDQVERSLAEGVNVNAVMIDDYTALMLASGLGHIDVVERLINAGANLDAAGSTRPTALLFAVNYGNTDCVKRLIHAGADLNAALPDGTTPLSIAAQENNIDCLKLLINAGADLNAAMLTGETPLSIATELGNIDCVEALIKAGAK
ncbi:ankyrin repeat domain-containing protein [Endozoicomonas sp. ALD040]|uniref:ankyrin repeat domain-containing protein n=1 Tax=unclassified Endozoicomonas TaxID=2644528 RepID=UPI003BAFDA2E